MKFSLCLRFFIFCCLTFHVCFGQQKIDFSHLDRTMQQTDILLTDVSPFTPLLKTTASNFSMYDFSMAYKALAKSDEDHRFQSVEALKKMITPSAMNRTVSIGILHTSYEWVSKEAHQNGWVHIQNHQMLADSLRPIFKIATQTIVAPLAVRKKGLQTTFVLDDRFMENTTHNSIVKVKANFDDGTGEHLLTAGQTVTVLYPTSGEKLLQFTVYFEDGTVVHRTSPLKIEYSNADYQQQFGWNIQVDTSIYTPDLSIYNETDLSPGQCEYDVFLSADSVLDKPIFIVDGFDPGDGRDIAAIYNMLSYTDSNGVQQNMGDYVRQNEGFDVVVINFPTYVNLNGNTIDGGADYIERNALSVVSVMQKINAEKVGEEQNVVIGPSMGGLITRYALCYMEQHNLQPDTRLWISFDSPHNGANVAMSIQYLMNYLGYGYPDIDPIKLAVDGMLRSKAAMQMLVDHIDAHGSGLPNTPAGAPGYFDEFQARMAALGYPQSTRNIAITNGSGLGNIFPDLEGNAVYPGYVIADGDIDAGTVLGMSTRLKVKARFMPEAGQSIEILNCKAQTHPFFWVTVDEFSATGESTTASDGVDTAPGGLFDLLGLLNGFQIDPQYQAMLQNALALLKVGHFNFIPTTSSMALYNQPDYYHQFQLGASDRPWDFTLETNPNTPFVNWYMADTNQDHVELTQENVNFVLCELIKPTYKLKAVSTQNVVIYEGQSFNVKLFFNVLDGCFAASALSVSGQPMGSTTLFSEDTVTQTGIVMLHCADFPVGNYTLHITPDSDTSKTVIVNVTVLSNTTDVNKEASRKIRIFPNPSTGVFTLDGMQSNQQKSVKVYGVNGAVVWSKNVYSDKTIIDLSSLSQGVYLLKIQTNTSVVVKKISLME